MPEYLNSRVVRIVALPRPGERERGEWQFPALRGAVAGGGGVEGGGLLRKYWFSVSDTEQERRIRARLDDPVRRRHLSEVDLQSIAHWDDYPRAKDEMMLYNDIPEVYMSIVDRDRKRWARIDMITHLLDSVPYHEAPPPAIRLAGTARRPPDTGARIPAPGTQPRQLRPRPRGHPRRWMTSDTVPLVTNPTAATAETGVHVNFGCGLCPATFGRIGNVVVGPCLP